MADQAHPFFAAGSPFLNHPLLTEERTHREVDFLVRQLNLAPGQRILDVGCGFGRHCIAFARRGFQVTGLDPSAAMIQAAKERAAATGVTVDFRQERGEDFVTEQRFDAAVCLFTTLGQMDVNPPDADRDNRGLVRRVADALKPGGGFAVEAPQRDPYAAALKAEERFGGSDRYTLVTRAFDPERSVVDERFRLVSPEGEQRFHLRYRLFRREEVLWLLREAGLREISLFGDFRGGPLTEESPFMLILASR